MDSRVAVVGPNGCGSIPTTRENLHSTPESARPFVPLSSPIPLCLQSQWLLRMSLLSILILEEHLIMLIDISFHRLPGKLASLSRSWQSN
jgi:hypothetical protein